MKQSPLPIDEILPVLKRVLVERSCAVLQAPPGAGKTTRVPLALLDESWLTGQKILMLEPRRLAAANAARHMAGMLGEEVGKTVGYAIRFDRCVSPHTRLEVVTEGILTLRLQNDPALQGVGLVIFDEFHERNLHSDLSLALCRDAQQGLREDLRLLVMSATLDAAPVSRLLDDAPLLTSVGRSHPLDIRYLGRDLEGVPIVESTASAVHRALQESSGDLLVFLPGAGEIRRCAALLNERNLGGELLICPLYGELPFAEQERAILPQSLRKVVLATNIAETSLTIEGVRVVVDSGLARQPRFDPACGLSRLETVRISAASAAQRAGRAGRLGPGVCYRLWSEATQGSLLPFTPPEIRQADLAELALELARWGITDAETLDWLDPPPAGALAGARDLLRLLGVLDKADRITALGLAMGGLGAHPRLAAMLIAGKARRRPLLASQLAALLNERDLQRSLERDLPAESDLLEEIELLRHGRPPGRVDPRARRTLERAAAQWCKRLGGPAEDEPPSVEAVGRLLGTAFPDRIARQRDPGSGRYILANGRGARLSSSSLAANPPPFLVAVEIFGGDRREGEIRKASLLKKEWIEEDFADRLTCGREVFWDERDGRLVAREVLRLGAVLLEEKSIRASGEERVSALVEVVRRSGLEILGWNRESRQLLARLRFVLQHVPEGGWPDVSAAALTSRLEEWLGPYLLDCRTRTNLQQFDPLPALQGLLDWPLLQRLDQEAPTHLKVPSGSRIRLDYESEGPPVLAVKLQELFGWAETPTLAGGRMPVVIHLLSPAQRPLAVTQDLKSFWDNVYPEVKKEFAGRYPKHPWPDDPWNAPATRLTKKKMKK